MTLRRWCVQGAAKAVRAVARKRRPRSDRFARLSLIATQTGTTLHVDITTGSGLEVSALTARHGEQRRLALADTTPVADSTARRVEATVDLADIAARLAVIYDGTRNATDDGIAEATLEMRIISSEQAPPKSAEPDESDDAKSSTGSKITYFGLLGDFLETDLRGFEPVALPDGRIASVRVSRPGNLVLVLGDEPPAADALVGADRVAVTDGVMSVQGTIDSGSGPVEKARLMLVGRGVPVEATGAIEFTPDLDATHQKHGRRQYDFHGSVDLRDLVDPAVTLPPHSVADLWMEITPAHGGQARLRRVGRVPVEQRFLVEESTVVVGDIALEAIPYFTSKARNIAVALEQFPADAYEQLAHPGRTHPGRAHPHSARTDTTRPIWIVGERPHTAQDNGYHLFHYLRAERRDIDAYYVITADSPDRATLAELDHVITFGSREHMDLIVRADRIVGTHHPYYLYPSRSKRMTKAITAPKVFLQHGVMAMKWTAHTYGKFGTDFRTDMFCVSSERERELIVGDFGYRPDEVAVTGLARFDALFTDDVTLAPKQVLIVPTWRDWLANDEVFAESDYLRSWKALIESPRMRELRDSGAEVVLYLHTLMQRYAHYFEDAPVTFVPQGEVDLQTLIKQSAVMITDYSSPAFDFSFLGKPVIFFQFDREQFYAAEAAHIDLDEELPGFASADPDAVLQRLETVLAPGFEQEERYRERAAKFLAHHDRNNAARITDAVEHLTVRRTLGDRLQQQRILRLVGLKLRRSRLYLPAMCAMFRLLSLLPQKRGLVLFDADPEKYDLPTSPRAAYEALVRKGDPRRRIWVGDRTPSTVDPQRIVIRRNSPRYVYYLARARYAESDLAPEHRCLTRRRGRGGGVAAA